MPWYKVRKTIRGRVYLYRQRCWREGGKVRTECQSLGPMDDANDIVIGNPFLSNTTNNKADQASRNTQSDEPANYPTSASEWVEHWKQSDYQGNLVVPASKRKKRNTTKRMPRSVEFNGDLSKHKVSHIALAREFETLLKNMSRLGLSTEQMPRVQVRNGTSARWKKLWYKDRTYVVTLQETGGRTAFKRAYREALAGIFLEELRRQDKQTYKRLLACAGHGFGKGVKIRTAMAEIMRLGTNAKTRFGHMKRSKRKGKDTMRQGELGSKLCSALTACNIDW